jgi:catechol 2,3-dioxygenase-like lactoylglutathione lyase family enzyme
MNIRTGDVHEEHGSRGANQQGISGAVLDHVAVAVERWSDAWSTYVGRLGGRWSSGGLNTGFAPAQLRFANGAKVEVLQPHGSGTGSFLRRFLDRNGPGPHHLTFKVPDLAASLELARSKGLEPVGVNLSTPWWMEAFLHPRQATGIVVQLAQAAGEWTSPSPEGFPEPPAGIHASLLRAVHAVADMDEALAIFRDFLGGTVTGRSGADDGSWVTTDLAWGGPLALRLLAPGNGFEQGTALAAWLEGRRGRLHHLAFSQAGDQSTSRSSARSGTSHPVVPGADQNATSEVIDPSANFGTRLVIEHAWPGISE